MWCVTLDTKKPQTKGTDGNNNKKKYENYVKAYGKKIKWNEKKNAVVRASHFHWDHHRNIVTIITTATDNKVEECAQHNLKRSGCHKLSHHAHIVNVRKTENKRRMSFCLLIYFVCFLSITFRNGKSRQTAPNSMNADLNEMNVNFPRPIFSYYFLCFREFFFYFSNFRMGVCTVYRIYHLIYIS